MMTPENLQTAEELLFKPASLFNAIHPVEHVFGDIMVNPESPQTAEEYVFEPATGPFTVVFPTSTDAGDISSDPSVQSSENVSTTIANEDASNLNAAVPSNAVAINTNGDASDANATVAMNNIAINTSTDASDLNAATPTDRRWSDNNRGGLPHDPWAESSSASLERQENPASYPGAPKVRPATLGPDTISDVSSLNLEPARASSEVEDDAGSVTYPELSAHGITLETPDEPLASDLGPPLTMQKPRHIPRFRSRGNPRPAIAYRALMKRLARLPIA